MNYEIALLNMIPNYNEPSTFWDNCTKFVSEHGFDRLAYNLDNKWIWDVRGHDGFEADGPCVFIRWIEICDCFPDHCTHTTECWCSPTIENINGRNVITHNIGH